MKIIPVLCPPFSECKGTRIDVMFPTHRFFTSLFFGYLLLIGMIFGLGFLWVSHEVKQRVLHLTERFQEHLLDVARIEFQRVWPNIEKQQIEQYWQYYTETPGVRLTVIDVEGRVLGDTEFSAVNMEPHLPLDRPEILAAMDGKRGTDVRYSRTMNIEYRYLAAPIIKEDKVVAVVRIAFPATLFHENQRIVFGSVFFGFVLMFLATVFFIPLLLYRLWYKPLRLLNNEVRRIADGNLEPLPSIDGSLEIVQLSQSLESIRRTGSERIETITRQREGLQVILRHLPDAIFAINRSAEVIYFNAAAKKLFRIESTADYPFVQEIVRNAAIVGWYLQCRKTPSTPSIERKEVDLFGHKHFLELEFVATGAATDEDVAFLLIVSDLTESVQANKMKTDFVANASHELRTPLAAIRAALDNISDDVLDDRETLEKIVQIVNRHVSRFDALIEDLLALNSVEDETPATRLEETCVAEQRLWIEELFHKRINEKRLDFSVVSDFLDVPFRIDNKRLRLVLQNLIDNAVKFTPSGGQIVLDIKQQGLFLVIECRDTGIGIATEEQRRVFERFYQGDSSKTGDGRLRGTGLGLAIVKHAVERLNGSISLESRLAQGSIFTVRIPVDFI